MTPTDALNFLTDYCRSHMPLNRLSEYNDAYEVLRKMVVDDIAKRKNSAETERTVREPL